ncbi:hypothetical protein Q428_07825 [Fervidicella metallireducens AeB]|uniref:Helix-hairpin-helix DNA-binding motif class 1 domain-containing protein n=1 Tax=Fervidicella metallireducens AeB TaxID=1403537 RepID=A0A017RUP2_9CLOT|nr:ComEA family DNA-binding protein [Fervidicella metallireducens]EYE88483.1 hypothetical protein Q428_07825 [Fervidicella metallireducens AeB]
MDLSKREKIGLCVFSVIIVFIISFNFYKNKRNSLEAVVIEKNEVNRKDVNSIDESETITVYICGEIKKPGVYTLKKGERLAKLVQLSDGFTQNADTTLINLAARLKDEDFIRIPSKNNTNVSNISQGIQIKPLSEEKININTANKEQLKSLPRIGEALAQRIIDFREKNGLFSKIEDIKKVSGIGDKMFENIKDKITVN